MTREPKVEPYRKVAVIGAGAWGTALASVAREGGADVRIWGRDHAVLSDIAQGRNSRYLNDAELPAGLKPTGDLAEALAGVEAVLLVLPSFALREISAKIAGLLSPGTPVLLGTKGIEPGTGRLMTAVVSDLIPKSPVGIVSGPTFAIETVKGHPTAAVVAFAFDEKDYAEPTRSPAARFSATLTSKSFRPYVSDDIIGVEVGGAVKNVIAIASGMISGAGMAENTRAALLTRGLEEMKRMAVALGGRRETLSGLSGMGDLTLTCSSKSSRNFSLGFQLGQGLARDACFEGFPVVVEGEATSKAVTDLARRKGIELPICETVRAVLHEGVNLESAFGALWYRPLKSEGQGIDLSFDHPFSAQPLKKPED